MTTRHAALPPSSIEEEGLTGSLASAISAVCLIRARCPDQTLQSVIVTFLAFATTHFFGSSHVEYSSAHASHLHLSTKLLWLLLLGIVINQCLIH